MGYFAPLGGARLSSVDVNYMLAACDTACCLHFQPLFLLSTLCSLPQPTLLLSTLRRSYHQVAPLQTPWWPSAGSVQQTAVA